jgi:hypothetical protein
MTSGESQAGSPQDPLEEDVSTLGEQQAVGDEVGLEGGTTEPMTS